MEKADEKSLKSFTDIYNDSRYIVSNDNRKIVVVEEKTRKYTLKNDLEKVLVVYHIDGGIITENIPKCDYGVYSEDKILILIELKGKDYDHACAQINSTIDSLKIDKQIKIFARIVLSKAPVPHLRTSSETKLKKKLMQIQEGLKRSSIEMSEKLSEIYDLAK